MDYDGCQIDEFKCSAGECIKLTQVCDSMEDCGDGRDEFGCATGTCLFPKHTTLCTDTVQLISIGYSNG